MPNRAMLESPTLTHYYGGIPIKPTIVAIAAVTIDGKIARYNGHFPDWTSPEDKMFFHSLLDQSDAVVVGKNTFRTAEEPLLKRNCIVFTRAVRDVERRGARLLFYNADGPSSLEAIVEPYRHVAVLGGTRIYSYFLERDLIDDLHLTIEPIVFGGGLDLFKHEFAATKRFQLVSVRQLNQVGTVLLHYRRPPVQHRIAGGNIGQVP
jgi:dihydrofolate reductase